jgi:hypothetical protein
MGFNAAFKGLIHAVCVPRCGTLAKYSSCMHNVSLWCVRVTIIATETQKFLLYYFWPTCKYQQFTNRRALPWKCNNGFHLHCCRATKYFVMLSTIRTYWGLHAKCLMFLSDFNQIWSPSADFRKYPPYMKFRENWSKGRRADTHG